MVRRKVVSRQVDIPPVITVDASWMLWLETEPLMIRSTRSCCGAQPGQVRRRTGHGDVVGVPIIGATMTDIEYERAGRAWRWCIAETLCTLAIPYVRDYKDAGVVDADVRVDTHEDNSNG